MIRCRLGWHRWTAWSLPYPMLIVKTKHLAGGIEIWRSDPSEEAYQNRRCKDCGREAQRHIGSWAGCKESQTYVRELR